MGLLTESKQIGDHVYTVTQLDAVRGRRVALRLGKVLAPAASKAASALDKAGAEKAKAASKMSLKPVEAEGEATPESEENSLAGFSLEQLATTIEAALGGLSEEDFEFFCETFASTTTVDTTGEDGRPRKQKLNVIFGLHFAAEYTAMIKWLLFAVEVNFGNFSGLLGKRRAS